MKKAIILLIILSFTVLAFSLDAQYQKPKPNIGVIVLCKKISPFKQSVLDSLAATYTLEMLHPKKASDIKSENYKSILVVDELLAWTWFNGKLKKFSKALDPKHTVYFITSGDKDWKWKQQGMKAVTSASEPARKEKVVKELRIKIEDLEEGIVS